MAKTGSITITQNSQNVANNTSNITVKCIIKTTGESYRGEHRTGTCTINGTKYSFTHGAPANSTTIVYTITLNVSHNTDGTKTVSASFNYDGGWVTASTSKTLTTIKRAVTPTLSTSKLTLTNGGKTTVTIGTSDTGVPSSYTYDIYYSFNGSADTLIASGVKLSYQWSADHNTLAKLIPNGTSGEGYIKVYTKNGSTNIGNKTVKFSAEVGSTNLKPTISSITVKESATIPSALAGTYIKGKSKLNVSISASSFQANITNYKTTISGSSSSYSGNSFITSTINSSGTVTVTVTVTDSRGQTATSSINVTVVDYANPSIKGFGAVRTDVNGNTNDDGDRVKFSYNVSVSPVNNKNAKSLVIQQLIGTTWTNIQTVTMSGYTLNSSVVSTKTFDLDTEHQFRLQLKDSFTTASATKSVSTSYTLINFHKDGHGISFGRAAQGDGFDVSLDSTFRRYNEFISSTFGQTMITRQGSTNGAAIGFKNDAGILGYIGMNGVNTGLYRYSADTNSSYLMLDSSNFSRYALSLNGGTLNGKLIFKNKGVLSYPMVGLDSNGAEKALIAISSSNNLDIGSSTAEMSTGNTNIYATNGNIRFSNRTATVYLEDLDNATYNAYFRPAVTGKTTLGTTSYRYYGLYSSQACNTSSDERLKSNIIPMHSDLATFLSGDNSNLFEKMHEKLNPVAFSLNMEDATEHEGRMHFGFIAQHISKLLEELGLSDKYVSFVSHSSWTDEETGEEKDEYSLRYEEFIALNTFMIQKLGNYYKNLENKYNDLLDKYNELSSKITQ